VPSESASEHIVVWFARSSTVFLHSSKVLLECRSAAGDHCLAPGILGHLSMEQRRPNRRVQQAPTTVAPMVRFQGGKAEK
jgi:hypothetical protein